MSGASVPDYLDPDEIPFTADEILRTFRLLADSEAEAQAIALQVTEGARQVYAERVAALAAEARGSTNLDELNHGIYFIYPEFFAALATLSPELSARVESYWVTQRAKLRPQRIRDAHWHAGFHPLHDPPDPTVIATVDAQEAAEREQWTTIRAAVETELREKALTTRPDDVHSPLARP
ncbi:MAG TPA: hypothetical protein VGE27_15675 [Gemmatimonas sp.]|uniref:hypothetical protein n=1 Tax=Gemmatimonas sp. TaxID=1962908 RepID=UPI002ED95E4D